MISVESYRPLVLQFVDPLADRGVDELDLVDAGWSVGVPSASMIAALAEVLFDQLLADADHLEVHAEDVRHGRDSLPLCVLPSISLRIALTFSVS